MRKIALVLFVIGLLIPSYTLKAQVAVKPLPTRDTLNISRDSLVQLIRIKDSILHRANRDSVKMSNFISQLEFKSDSLYSVLNQSIYEQKVDSANRMRRYLNFREHNRRTRQELYGPVGIIEADSVRSNIKQIIDLVYQDTSYVPKPQVLRSSMDRLMFHLANDSVALNFVNARQDTTPIILKKDLIDSTAFYVMNSKSDSAKLFVRSVNKNTLYMWVGDDLWLKQLLKKEAPRNRVDVKWSSPDQLWVARRPIPVAPVKFWTRKADLNLMVNQLALANWAKGGSSNITFTSNFNASVNYAKGNIKWDNTLLLTYGIQKSELSNLRKNQDVVKLISNLSHKAFKNFDYTLGLSLLTQSFKGYNYPNDSVPVCKFFAPADLTLSLGMTYKPGPKLTVIISPAAGMLRFVLDTVLIDQTKYGVAADKRMMAQLGAKVSISHSTTIFENVGMSNTLVLFSNYIDHPEKVNFDWELGLNLKVNRHLSTAITTHLLYDNNTLVPIYEVRDGIKVKTGEGKRIQFMEALGVSFKYIF